MAEEKRRRDEKIVNYVKLKVVQVAFSQIEDRFL